MSVASLCARSSEFKFSAGRLYAADQRDPIRQCYLPEGQISEMTKSRIAARVLPVMLLLGLSACTNPYDPVQRTIGGGLIGAGSGAAIGAAAAGGHGAALGAAVGGAVGAIGGLITTPPPPRYRY